MTKVPENISHYPEFSMFGELPYWDFYVRHAEKKYQLTQKKDDFRQVRILDEVKGQEILDFKLTGTLELPVIILNNVTKPI